MQGNSLGFTQEIGNDPRFLPALFKIGLNLVSLNFGPATAAESAYDHIRCVVKRRPGAPDLLAAMDQVFIPAAVTRASGPIGKAGRQYPLFRITLLGLVFTIDMDPGQRGLEDMRGAATLLDEPLYVFPGRRAFP